MNETQYSTFRPLGSNKAFFTFLAVILLLYTVAVIISLIGIFLDNHFERRRNRNYEAHITLNSFQNSEARQNPNFTN